MEQRPDMTITVNSDAITKIYKIAIVYYSDSIERVFVDINLLSICSLLLSRFLPLSDIFVFFPIQMHGRPKLTLP